MKDYKYGIGFDLKVQYCWIADSLFADEPYEEQIEVKVNDFKHLSYLLSDVGIAEICEKEGFDLNHEISVSIVFRDSSEKGEFAFTIHDKDVTPKGVPRVTYHSTHIIDDDGINDRIERVYENLLDRLKQSAERDGVKI